MISNITTIFLLLHGTVSAFQLPKIKFVGLQTKEDPNAPQIIVQNGPDEAKNLRLRLEKHCDIDGQETAVGKGLAKVSCRWEPYLQESYEAADVIFQELANKKRAGENQEVVLSFPSMRRAQDLARTAEALQSERCMRLLGLDDVRAELYPSAPAPYLRIKFSTLTEVESAPGDPKASNTGVDADSAISDTQDWVNNFLGRFRLCPYTSSISRAAVGLSSVGVPVGGVHVQVANTNPACVDERSYSTLKAAELVSSFWSEVVTLLNSTQEEWATSLVVCPDFDREFESFIEVCDSIIEPTVVATQATDFIGRAWFHPQYSADAVGHSQVIAGHAVPHRMVEGFMNSLHSASGGKHDQGSIDYGELVDANDRVRQTPHATINILRRSQLKAAGEYEKGLGEKRPKANSIYVRNAVRLAEAKEKQYHKSV